MHRVQLRKYHQKADKLCFKSTVWPQTVFVSNNSSPFGRTTYTRLLNEHVEVGSILYSIDTILSCFILETFEKFQKAKL